MNCPSGWVRRCYGPSAAESLPDCGSITDDTIFVVRNGDVLDGGGTDVVAWPRTFVYTPNGTLDLSGDKTVYWTAPQGGDFADLVFWTDSDRSINLSGNRSLDVEGVFFAPNAAMSLSGLRSFSNQGMQTVLRSLDLSGSAQFVVYPLPDRHVSPGGVSTPGGTQLIR